MIAVNGSSFGRAAGRLRRYPGVSKTPASSLPAAGRSHNAAPLPAGSPPQSKPQNEPERIDPRPSSPSPCRFTTKANRCRFFTPAQPDDPAASVRDFRSGAHSLPGGPEIGELVRVAVSGRFPAQWAPLLPGFVQFDAQLFD